MFYNKNIYNFRALITLKISSYEPSNFIANKNTIKLYNIWWHRQQIEKRENEAYSLKNNDADTYQIKSLKKEIKALERELNNAIENKGNKFSDLYSYSFEEIYLYMKDKENNPSE